MAIPDIVLILQHRRKQQSNNSYLSLELYLIQNIVNLKAYKASA
jgi:hypothetical protein